MRGEYEVVIQFQFTTTNNEAEYEAIIAGMNFTREIGVRNLEIKSNTQVLAGHIRGEYEAHEEKMRRYLKEVKEIMESFDKVIFTKIP